MAFDLQEQEQREGSFTREGDLAPWALQLMLKKLFVVGCFAFLHDGG